MSLRLPQVDGWAIALAISESNITAEAPSAPAPLAPARNTSRRVSDRVMRPAPLAPARRGCGLVGARLQNLSRVDHSFPALGGGRARPTISLVLTQRQELVLRKVVEEYLDQGAPVGSKSLAVDVEWGPSTIRHELANLEELGLLAHPHTSAGRVPTEAGYRYFVDRLLPAPEAPPLLSLSLVRHELDEAMRVTTETLSQVTNLLAIVTAPPIETSTIRHVEVLVLQPQVLMVVVITSTGGVTKRLFTFPSPVDSGLADWAASYLNERLVGLGLGARMLHQRLHDPSLSTTEQAFLDALAPVFTSLEDSAQHTLYVEGTGRLLTA